MNDTGQIRPMLPWNNAYLLLWTAVNRELQWRENNSILFIIQGSCSPGLNIVYITETIYVKYLWVTAIVMLVTDKRMIKAPTCTLWMSEQHVEYQYRFIFSYRIVEACVPRAHTNRAVIAQVFMFADCFHVAFMCCKACCFSSGSSPPWHQFSAQIWDG